MRKIKNLEISPSVDYLMNFFLKFTTVKTCVLCNKYAEVIARLLGWFKYLASKNG